MWSYLFHNSFPSRVTHETMCIPSNHILAQEKQTYGFSLWNARRCVCVAFHHRVPFPSTYTLWYCCCVWVPPVNFIEFHLNLTRICLRKHMCPFFLLPVLAPCCSTSGFWANFCSCQSRLMYRDDNWYAEDTQNTSIPGTNMSKHSEWCELRTSCKTGYTHHQYVLFDLTFLLEAVSSTRIEKFCDPVDGRNPANQLRLVVYTIIYRFWYFPGG